MIKFTPSPENEILWSEMDAFFAKLSKPTKSATTPISNAVRWGIGENFADERAGDEGSWHPLSARTIAEREAQGYPGEHLILKRTGSYKDSFTNSSNPNHVDEIEITGEGWSIYVGSDDERVDILELGGWNGEGYVPPRPATYLGADQEYVLGNALDEFFISLAN